MRRVWTEEMDAELRKHYALGDLFALALELGVTVRAVRSRAKKIGCRREVNVGRAWSERELEVLRESYPVMSAREVAALVGHSEKAVWSRSRKLGLKTSSEFIRSRGRENAQHPRSVATRFQKGLVPKNKGVRIERWMSAEGLRRSRAVRFKKGHVPANTKPVGYERLSKDGYVYIKACDGMPMVLKHRWVWEQAHGAIPKGYNVMFVDGDRTNCALGNLRLVSRGDAARRQVLMESAEKRRQRCERSCASRNEAIRRDKLRIHWGLEPYTKLVKRW